jgi:hypothetical protein
MACRDAEEHLGGSARRAAPLLPVVQRANTIAVQLELQPHLRPLSLILSPPSGERTDAKRQERGSKMATVFFDSL